MHTAIRSVCKISNYVAGLSLIMIALIIIAQIVVRTLGHSLPSTDDFAAWAMAATVFLALPSTFHHGRHIRVLLAVDRLRSGPRRHLVRLGNAISLALFLAATWFAAIYVYESFIYNDTSQGVIAVPLWIPQVLMLLGMLLSAPVLLALAISGQEKLEQDILDQNTEASETTS